MQMVCLLHVVHLVPRFRHHLTKNDTFALWSKTLSPSWILITLSQYINWVAKAPHVKERSLIFLRIKIESGYFHMTQNVPLLWYLNVPGASLPFCNVSGNNGKRLVNNRTDGNANVPSFSIPVFPWPATYTYSRPPYWSFNTMCT